MNIYVGDLPYNLTEEVLRQTFEAFGQVRSVRIIKDKYTGQPLGFCFVEMPDRAEGDKAIRCLNGKDLLGRQMDIKEAFSPTFHEGTGRHRTGDGHKRHHIQYGSLKKAFF